jgi:hypothetical protein
MNHDDGRAGRVAPPQIDHIQPRSANLDRISRLRKSTLDIKHAGLREQCQQRQRCHDNH